MGDGKPGDIGRIGDADEIGISSRRPDGTDRPFVVIWAVRHDGDLYVRSAYGPENGWYRRALASGAGRVQGAGIERDVAFARVDPADAAVQDAVDAAYRAKYGARYARIVQGIVGPAAHGVTLRVSLA
jgi:hypothetical protein